MLGRKERVRPKSHVAAGLPQREGRTDVPELGFARGRVPRDVELHLLRHAHRPEEEGERTELRKRTLYPLDGDPHAEDELRDDRLRGGRDG